MALGILNIIFICIAIGVLGAICLLFYKNGETANKNVIFLGIQLYTIIISLLYITSLPSNYIFSKVIGFGIILLSIGTIVIKKKDFKLARIFSSILILVALILLFFAI